MAVRAPTGKIFSVTVFNHKDEFKEELKKHMEEGYIVGFKYQLERGVGGTEHYQGAICCAEKHSCNAVKTKFNGERFDWHWELARNPTALQRYVGKQDTRIDGPWEDGFFTTQGQSAGIAAAASAAKKMKLSEVAANFPETFIKHSTGLTKYSFLCGPKPDDVIINKKVFVLWGSTGVGKTRTARAFSDDFYLVPVMHDRLWFDGYEGQKTIIFDEFKGQIPLTTLLQIIDIYAISLEVKGAHVKVNAPTVIFTSNFPPDQWYDWTGRREHREAMWRRFTAGVWEMLKEEVSGEKVFLGGFLLTRPFDFVPNNKFYLSRF